jgi:hypothetical protein
MVGIVLPEPWPEEGEAPGEDARLSRAQWHVAWALARAFGHEWAQRADVTALLAQAEDGDQSAASVRAAVVPPPDFAWAIVAPTVVYDGDGKPVVVHVTGTGRLRWAVHPDGSVGLEVHRPAPVGVVITAWLGACRDDDREVSVVQSGPAAFRHWRILAQALAAVDHADRGWIFEMVRDAAATYEVD